MRRWIEQLCQSGSDLWRWRFSGAGFDLCQRWADVFDPVARCGNVLLLIHGDSARRGLVLFRRWSWNEVQPFPMPAMTIQSIIHGLGFGRAHSTATHRIVKHAIAFLPRPRLLVVSDIVKNRGVAIFSVKRPAH